MKSRIIKLYLLLLFIVSSTITFVAQDPRGELVNKVNFNLLTEIIKMSDQTISVTNEHLFAVKNKDALFYFYSSETRKKIIPTGFEQALPFVGKTALVKLDNQWGLINREGTFVMKAEPNMDVHLSSYEKYAVFGDSNKLIYSMSDGSKKSGFINCAEPSAPDFYVVQTLSKKFQLVSGYIAKPMFKIELDSIIQQNFLMYKENVNLVILKNKSKYGLSLANGIEIRKIEADNMKFIGQYIAIFEKNLWNYYNFENGALHLVVSSKFECNSPVYQPGFIGIVQKEGKFNMLKIDGSILARDFKYIDYEGTYGVDDGKVYIFNRQGEFYVYYTDK